MTPAEYTERRAELLVDLSETVAATTSDYGRRLVELLETPEERSDLLIEEACGYLAERRAEESGDAADGEAWGAELAAWCDLSWREIHEEPPATRGDTWSTARRIVLALCQTQAVFEIAGRDLLTVGDELADVTRLAARMGEKDKRHLATAGATKETVSRIAESRKIAAAAVEKPADVEV
jgi:hypothetical protein